MTGESVRKLAQAYEVSARTVHAALMRTSALKEVGQVGDQTIFIGDEEGAIQDTQGGRGSLRVLNNILTVWESARGKERLAGLILTRA